MSTEQIAQDFVNFYYQTFDNNRGNLANLYVRGSVCKGQAEIAQKLTNLPFQKLMHRVSTIDSLPSLSPNAIVIHVTGELKVDDEASTQRFSQTFQLVNSNGSFFVLNDLFRLNYG